MTNARWPNKAAAAGEAAPWAWSRALDGCKRSLGGSTFTMDAVADPDVLRLLKWSDEVDAFVHGYWEWDWGDAYAPVSNVQRRGDTVELSYRKAPTCKPGARWMGVNLLCELDAPGEFYIDTERLLVYFIPPEPPAGVDGPLIALMHQAGGVLNVTADARNVSISDLSVVNGRHAGILAAGGVVGLRIERVAVHAHGSHGIVLTGASGGSITDSGVYDVGCSGIRATAGVAETLRAGGLVVANNHVHHVAQWKRSYMPGIYWGGVGNTFRGNVVEYHPHACFVGGGDFEDGVDNLFEGNTVRAAPGRLSGLSVFLWESILYGAFVWARRALNGPKRRFPDWVAARVRVRDAGLRGILLERAAGHRVHQPGQHRPRQRLPHDPQPRRRHGRPAGLGASGVPRRPAVGVDGHGESLHGLPGVQLYRRRAAQRRVGEPLRPLRHGPVLQRPGADRPVSEWRRDGQLQRGGRPVQHELQHGCRDVDGDQGASGGRLAAEVAGDGPDSVGSSRRPRAQHDHQQHLLPQHDCAGA
jgi:hypothetical protein